MEAKFIISDKDKELVRSLLDESKKFKKKNGLDFDMVSDSFTREELLGLNYEVAMKAAEECYRITPRLVPGVLGKIVNKGIAVLDRIFAFIFSSQRAFNHSILLLNDEIDFQRKQIEKLEEIISRSQSRG